MQAKKVGLIGLLSILVLSMACQLSAATPVVWIGTPTAQARAKTQTVIAATQSAFLTSQPTRPPTLTPSPYTRTITPVPTNLEDHSWLLFPAADGTSLHAFGIDTSKDSILNLPPLVSLTDLVDGLSPDGTQLLLRAGRVEELNELSLYSLKNPYEEISIISPLLSVFLQREIVTNNDRRAEQALLGITQKHGVVWTTDGKYAAFTAALDGDSGDIYLYDPKKSLSERMTVRYRQSLTPFWSPDNAWLIFQEAVSIDQETGWKITAVSDVSMPDYDRTRFLYLPPEGSLGDKMVGWLNDKIFLSYSQTPVGNSTLRQVNLEEEKETIVFQGQFSSLEFDPIGKVISLLINKDDAIANKLDPGIYISTTGGSPFKLVLSGEFSSLEWSPEAGLFMAAGGHGVSCFDTNGSKLIIANESNLVFSPGKNWLIAWNETKLGVRLYTTQGNLLQTAGNAHIKTAFWQPDSKGFYLVTDEGLYRVLFPLLNPILVTSDVYQGDDFQYTWLLGQ